MLTNKLICLGQAYSYTDEGTEYDAFVYFDPKSLELFVIEGTEGASGRCESDLIPAADYVREHPEWRKEIRRKVLERLEPTTTSAV